MLYLRIHMYVCILPSPIYAHICTACARIGMRILRLVGSLKLWVSFAEYSLFYRALLQKRPLISRSLLIIATLYARCAYPPRLYMHAYICRYRIICITHTYTCSHYRTTFTLCMLIYIYTYSIMYVWLPVYANDYLYMHIDRKNLPPPGGFPIYYVPSSRTESKRTPHEEFVPGASRGVLLLTVFDEGT